MHHYRSDAINRLSTLLESRARAIGFHAISVKDEIFPLHVAMDATGPMCWPLAMHALALASLSGMTAHARGNLLPFAVVENNDAPYGVEVVMQPSALPFGMSYLFMDASLEHAACVAMMDLGYSPEEWNELPESQRAIPLEPYLADLEKNWFNEKLQNGDAPSLVANFPALMDIATLSHQMKTQTLGETNGTTFRIPSAR